MEQEDGSTYGTRTDQQEQPNAFDSPGGEPGTADVLQGDSHAGKDLRQNGLFSSN